MSERECPRIRCTHGSGIQLTTYTHLFCATDAFPPATAQRMRCRADRDAVRYRSDLDRIAPRLSTPLRWSAGYDKKVCFVTRRCIRVAVTPADGAQLLGDSVWTLGIGESRLGSPNVTGRLHVELKLRKHADFIRWDGEPQTAPACVPRVLAPRHCPPAYVGVSVPRGERARGSCCDCKE
jgi:hypothetical protein